jgi:hypothetical protein
MSWNESDIVAARRAIFHAAQDMLAQRLSYIEGARKIHASIRAAKVNEVDPDLVPFIGIISETDALPTEQTRSLWQAAALQRLQPEIDRSEAWARQLAETHCRNLVERFSSGRIKLEPPL